MQLDGPQMETDDQAELPSQKTIRKVLSLDRRTPLTKKTLEENLSSALQAADNELGDILHEVDEISQLLKSDKPDKKTLNVVAHPAVWSAVKQALLDRELRCLALTDDLTCLYNRRGFFAAATHLLKLATRNSQSLLLLYFDLDNFKKVNDLYGHREGDLALIRTADSLERTFRGADVLARLGGDEFVVLALESSNQTREVILRRFQRNLRKAHSAEPRFQISVSVGVARFNPKLPVSLGELMLQADKAMYEEKRRREKPCQNNPKCEPGSSAFRGD